MSEKLNAGFYHEALDRAHTVQVMLEELLGEHWVIEAHPELKVALEAAEDAIADLYQRIGVLSGRPHFQRPAAEMGK